MIIVRDVFGNIICNVNDFYINTYSDDFRREVINGIYVTCNIFNEPAHGPFTDGEAITEEFNLKREASRVMDWIFDQMKVQGDAANIIIDMKKCPFLQD